MAGIISASAGCGTAGGCRAVSILRPGARARARVRGGCGLGFAVRMADARAVGSAWKTMALLALQAGRTAKPVSPNGVSSLSNGRAGRTRYAVVESRHLTVRWPKIPATLHSA